MQYIELLEQIKQHDHYRVVEEDSLQYAELLERADSYIVSSLAIDDSAARMAKTNLAYGLAKIHWVQEALGYPADALFIAAPDMTTTRYAKKWQWGQAIGGILNWGDGSLPLTFLDLQITTSTALVGGLNHEPDVTTVMARVDKLRRNRPTIMGVEVGWDYDNGNHFINAYRVKALEQGDLPPYAFVIHGGDSEVKGPSILGTGLDYEKSQVLRDHMKVIHTPLGPVRILLEQAACDYHTMYLRYEEYSKQKCLAIGEALFGSFTIISNEAHHGFADPNTALLSCYHFQPGAETLYPITLRSDLPTYLVRGIPNINPELLAQQPLAETVKRRVQHANILPHGGGYTFPEVIDVADTLMLNGQRYFILHGTNGGKRVLAYPSTLPYAYRGLEVIDRVVSGKLGETVAELHPIFSITT
jgi:hypothetical protein